MDYNGDQGGAHPETTGYALVLVEALRAAHRDGGMGEVERMVSYGYVAPLYADGYYGAYAVPASYGYVGPVYADGYYGAYAVPVHSGGYYDGGYYGGYGWRHDY